MTSKILQLFKGRKAEDAFTILSYGSNVYAKVKDFFNNKDAQEEDAKRVKNMVVHVIVNKTTNQQTEPTLQESYAKQRMFLNLYFFCTILDFLVKSLFSYHNLSFFWVKRLYSVFLPQS